MKKKKDSITGFSCPIARDKYSKILLAHGGGGRLSLDLVRQILLPCFNNRYLEPLHDGAVFKLGGKKLAFSTDSFVVSPIFFPGGDIGTLAVNGTVNDLAMCGAKPLYLSLSFILEEGFDMTDFVKIVESIGKAAKKAGVLVITGDTKVVDKGKGDKIFINTAGVGLVLKEVSPNKVKTGDKIILSGEIGAHGAAVMLARGELGFEANIKSDTAALDQIVKKILSATNYVHCLRDATRGGVASVLNEIAMTARVGIEVVEDKIAIPKAVDSLCELLGLDPLYLANEGKFLVFVDKREADKVLKLLKKDSLGKNASIIGEVVSEHKDLVMMKTRAGSRRIVDLMSGEQLPRIC